MTNYRNFPKVPIERRAWAFLIDFVSVWLVSMVAGGGLLKYLVFIVAWWALRVIVVDKNRGQSLGRWALDMKLMSASYNRIPDLLVLSKREAILGLLSLLASIGLNIGFQNGLSMMILISPLLVNGCVALADERYQQAFHDRVAETIIVQTNRGFSLDLRLKKIIAELRQNMRQ